MITITRKEQVRTLAAFRMPSASAKRHIFGERAIKSRSPGPTHSKVLNPYPPAVPVNLLSYNLRDLQGFGDRGEAMWRLWAAIAVLVVLLVMFGFLLEGLWVFR